VRRKLIIVGILLVVGWMVWRSGRPDFLLGGIQVNEPDHYAWIDALDEGGFNTAAITVYAKQGDWDSANLWFEEEEPWVVGEAIVAKEKGLHVVLVLRVALDHAFERNKFFWHGMIMPPSDREVGEWFDRYEDFVGQWARIAEDVGIDVLAVGSELNSLTNTVEVDEIPALEEYWANEEKVDGENAKILAHREEIEGRDIWVRGNDDYETLEPYLADRSVAHAAWAREISYQDDAEPITRINDRRRLLRSRWVELIGKTREIYSGTITYAANFDQYYFVDFWDQLDLIGINAYFPLRHRDLPDELGGDRVALFRSRWSTILHEIDDFRRQQGVPEHRVLFTELGYVKRANSTIQPWEAHGFTVLPSGEGPKLMVWEDQPEEPLERAQAVEGLFEANREFRGGMLAGILYWKLSTEPLHEEVEPFVLLIGDRVEEDPLLRSLQMFTSWRPFAL
jgi:hypothetical protein